MRLIVGYFVLRKQTPPTRGWTAQKDESKKLARCLGAVHPADPTTLSLANICHFASKPLFVAE